MNRIDLQELSTTRLQEAKILFEAGEYSGAYYLAGYAAECALKARIASFTQQHDFPDKQRAQKSYTHSLENLVSVAELGSELDERIAKDAIFAGSWAVAKNWSEEARYKVYSQGQTEELLAALNDNNHGVMIWLRLFW